MIMKEYGGEVPRSLTELVALPGVARKTASVVLGTAYGLAEGVVVDTHVQRWPCASADRSLRREEDRAGPHEVIPPESWIPLSHQIIWHGRRRLLRPKARLRDLHPRLFLSERGLET